MREVLFLMKNKYKNIFEHKLNALLNYFTISWSEPSRAAIFAIIAYSLFAFLRGTPWNLSNFPYFNYLADAFSNGQIFLRSLPPSVHDLSFFNGHYYLYWPPFPAIFFNSLCCLIWY